jgi:long-chain fatty acid transport protein
MVYKGQLSKAIGDFTQGTMTLSDNLEQPSEIGLGASYAFAGNTIALDFKRVNWASAKGYKDFGWEDQDVYAIGYQYAQDSWALRAGYNYAKSAVKSSANTVLNTLNLLGFPATVEKHYTVGGSYAFTKSTSVDLAYVYASAKDQAYDNMLQSTTTTKHTQDAFSAQLNLNF